MNEIVEPNTIIVPNKSFESPRVEYSFMVIPTNSSFREPPEFLAKIQHMIFNASFFFGCLQFVSESNVPPSVGLDVCLLVMSYLLFSPR